MSLILLRTDTPTTGRIRINGWPWCLPIGGLLLWYITAREQWMPEQILPPPSLVASTALSLLHNDLVAQWGYSLWHLVSGLLLGTFVGTVLGALFGRVPVVARLAEPLFYGLAQIPTLGWIPLFMVLFGIDDGLKLAVIMKAVIVPVTLHTQQAVTSLPETLREAGEVLQFSRWQRIRWQLIPASLPSWFTGLRLALSQAWVSLIVVELLASSAGIGYLMVWGRQLFQLDIVFVTIIVIGFSGMVMEGLIDRLYRRVVFWPQPVSERLPHKTGIHVQSFYLPVILLVLWQLASTQGWIDSQLFSSPQAVVNRFIEGVRSGELPVALLASLERTLSGGAIGILTGGFFGTLLALQPRMGQIFTPSLNVLRHIALFAWLPLLTAWVGNDNGGKIVFVALASFFPMFFTTLQSITHRNYLLDEVATVLRFGLLMRLRRVILPGAAPGMFAGLRLAMIYAWLGNIGAEYFMSSGTGIGNLMINAQQMLDMPVILCGMLLIGIIGVALDKAGRLLEMRATRWRLQEQR